MGKRHSLVVVKDAIEARDPEAAQAAMDYIIRDVLVLIDAAEQQDANATV